MKKILITILLTLIASNSYADMVSTPAEVGGMFDLIEILKVIAYFILTPLVLTVAIESGIAYLMKYRDKFSQARIAFTNVITNVSVNIINLIVIKVFVSSLELWSYIAMVVILEIMVVVAEWKLFQKWLSIDSKKALKLSLILNISSYVIGMVVIWSFFLIKSYLSPVYDVMTVY
jgi:hypothetical protein